MLHVAIHAGVPAANRAIKATYTAMAAKTDTPDHAS